MSGQIVVMVFKVVGSGLCVSSDDGQKVHDQIAAALREGKKIKVSFLNVESLTSAFLNSAVGQLYGEFSEDTIKTSITVAEMEQEDLALLKLVVETAKEYFSDPERRYCPDRKQQITVIGQPANRKYHSAENLSFKLPGLSGARAILN